MYHASFKDMVFSDHQMSIIVWLCSKIESYIQNIPSGVFFTVNIYFYVGYRAQSMHNIISISYVTLGIS
jgi:hypothetical protein